MERANRRSHVTPLWSRDRESSGGEQRRMWREMIIFADRHTINQAESSKTEAHSYPLWSVDSRGARQQVAGAGFGGPLLNLKLLACDQNKYL